jgi:hypothetical protein
LSCSCTGRWPVSTAARLHLSDAVPPGLEAVALAPFALAWIVFVWAMYVNRFFSSIPRIQSERGHAVITTGPYRFVRHPGHTAPVKLEVDATRTPARRGPVDIGPAARDFGFAPNVDHRLGIARMIAARRAR